MKCSHPPLKPASADTHNANDLMFTPRSSDIVFVRYSGEIADLAQRFRNDGFKVRVYEKHPDNRHTADHFVPQNKGNEASGYLQYIIEHYHCLPQHAVFLHDHEHSWHQNGNTYELVSQNTGTRVTYRSINSFTWTQKTLEWFPEILKWYKIYLRPELGFIQKYGDFTTGFHGCAQFIVHRDTIRKRSLGFYENLYKWLMTTDLPDYYSGRYLEYTWHLMWEQVSEWNWLHQKLPGFITHRNE